MAHHRTFLPAMRRTTSFLLLVVASLVIYTDAQANSDVGQWGSDFTEIQLAIPKECLASQSAGPVGTCQTQCGCQASQCKDTASEELCLTQCLATNSYMCPQTCAVKSGKLDYTVKEGELLKLHVYGEHPLCNEFDEPIYGSFVTYIKLINETWPAVQPNASMPKPDWHKDIVPIQVHPEGSSNTYCYVNELFFAYSPTAYNSPQGTKLVMYANSHDESLAFKDGRIPWCQFQMTFTVKGYYTEGEVAVDPNSDPKNWRSGTGGPVAGVVQVTIGFATGFTGMWNLDRQDAYIAVLAQYAEVAKSAITLVKANSVGGSQRTLALDESVNPTGSLAQVLADASKPAPWGAGASPAAAVATPSPADEEEAATTTETDETVTQQSTRKMLQLLDSFVVIAAISTDDVTTTAANMYNVTYVELRDAFAAATGMTIQGNSMTVKITSMNSNATTTASNANDKTWRFQESSAPGGPTPGLGRALLILASSCAGVLLLVGLL